jgi:hypothetical protein
VEPRFERPVQPGAIDRRAVQQPIDLALACLALADFP